MTDENDDKQRRERSRRRKRRAQRAGTKTTAAKKPDLTWLGLDWLDSSRTLGRAARNPAARESVTALIHGASMLCGPRGRAGNYGPGPDRRTMVGCFFGFFSLIHLRLSWARPSHAVAPCAGAHPESPPLPQSRTPVVGARIHSFQVPATLGPVKPFHRPPWDSLFSSNHPPTVANHQQDTDTLKHALPLY